MMAESSGRVARNRSSRIDRKVSRHPYQEFEGTPLWSRVDRAVATLRKNGDIELTTRREYVVGYICRAVGLVR